MKNEHFKAIIPDNGSNNPEHKLPVLKEIEHPSNEKPIIETETTVSFMGVEVQKGSGGIRTPDREKLASDTLTEFDLRMMRDLAVGISLRQPILIEAGSGIGKSRTVERICALADLEMYYANCHDMDVDILIGKMTVNDDPNAKNQFKWRDGVVIDAIRNGGILFLDEYNFMKGETRAGLHFILDAVINGKSTVTLVDNHGEIVPISPDLKIVAAQNPPGDKHTDREVLDPAQYTRFNFVKYPEDLPEETKSARALGELGIDNKLNFNEEDFLLVGGITKEALVEVPGIREIMEKYLEFAKSVSKMVENGDLAADQPQKPHFAFQRDHNRVMRFVQTFYRGDINVVFQKALTYYFVNKFESDDDRQKLLLNLKEVRVDIKPDARRTGLPDGKGKKKKTPETVVAETEKGKFDDIKARLRDLGKEFREDGSLTPEQYLTDLHPFMLETYKKWSYNPDQLKIVEEVTSSPDNIHIDETIPFDEMKAVNSDEAKLEANKSKIGELYLTSESVDFETAKLFTPEIPEKISKNGVGAVMKYIQEKYKETHILPDLKYYQYIAQLGDRHIAEKDPVKKKALLDQIPEQLRDGNYYFFPGSALVDESGLWMSPVLNWFGVDFLRGADRVENGWDSSCRVVLLER